VLEVTIPVHQANGIT